MTIQLHDAIFISKLLVNICVPVEYTDRIQTYRRWLAILDYIRPVISYKHMTYITEFSTKTTEYEIAQLNLHDDIRRKICINFRQLLIFWSCFKDLFYLVGRFFLILQPRFLFWVKDLLLCFVSARLLCGRNLKSNGSRIASHLVTQGRIF